MSLIDKRLSEEPVAASMSSTDILSGIVDAKSAQVPPEVLLALLNSFEQVFAQNVEVLGAHKALSYDGDGALLVNLTSPGPGGSEAAANLTLRCNSGGLNPSSQVLGQKHNQFIFYADENGFGLKTGIPYTHEDDAIPFDKDINQLGKELLQSQTILNMHAGEPWYNFKGDGFLTVPNDIDINFGTGDFSIVVRFRTSHDFSGLSGNLFFKGIGTQSYQAFIFTDNKVGFLTRGAGGSITIFSNDTINDGNWHIAAFLGNRGSTQSMYIDGILQTDTATTPADTITGTENLFIGRGNAANYFTGGIDGVVFYNHLLTAVEAKSISSNPQKAIDWVDMWGSNDDDNATTFVNASYTTAANETATGIDYTSDGGGGHTAAKGGYVIVEGFKYRFTGTLVLNSGTGSEVSMRTSATGGSGMGLAETTVNGENSFEFTANKSDASAFIRFSNFSTAADCEWTNIKLVQLGATIALEAKGSGEEFWVDSSDNGNDGVVTGATVENEHIYSDIDIRYKLKGPRLTTAQKNALTAVNGMIVYDTTLNKFQGFENSAWISFI